MPNRDMDSVKRDMTNCVKHVIALFKGAEVPLEAVPVASLALAMFRDYRKNTLRDIAEIIAEGTLSIEVEKKKKKRSWPPFS